MRMCEFLKEVTDFNIHDWHFVIREIQKFAGILICFCREHGVQRAGSKS